MTLIRFVFVCLNSADKVAASSSQCGRLVAASCATAALVAVGCSNAGPELAQVRGRITLDGKPLRDAAVMFVPETGRPATARTDLDGVYELAYTQGNRGALLGTHEVRISTYRPGYEGETPEGVRRSITERPERVPARYNEESELSVEVTPGNNEFNFDLMSE